MAQNLIIIFILTMIIHMFATLSYSLRLAGIRVNKLAVALSLTGTILLISRTANLIQAPMTAKMIDYARVNPDLPVQEDFRFILIAASIGTALGIFLFPTFVNIWGRVISRLEVTGSVLKMFSSVTLSQLKNTKHYVRRPALRISHIRYLGIPKRFILLNIVVTSIYTAGVLCSLYAAHLEPSLGTSASQASGLINGLATVLLTLFIDPQIGLITDKACHDEKYRKMISKIYYALMISRFLGTLLSQLILIPGAYFITKMVKFL